MFKVTTKVRYSVRMMVELALREEGRSVQLREIADAQGVSVKYLEQLATSLRNDGLVLAERGPQGGYKLGRPPQEITVRDIVECVEGPVDLLHCLQVPASCGRSGNCAARRLWARVGASIRASLAETTIADLRDEQLLETLPPAHC